MRPLRFALALCSAAALAACSSDREHDASSPATAEASRISPSASSEAVAVEAEDSGVIPEVAIETRDGTFVLALAGDEVFMRLSDEALAEASKELRKREVDEKDSRVGAMIENMVKKGVQKVVTSRIVYPLHDIRDVTYEDGEIVFDYRDKHVMSFESFKVDDDERVLEQFRPDDAQRFVRAVKAALRK